MSMSVMICGMEMPQDKAVAVVIHPDGTAYTAEMFVGVCTKYLADCTAVPVPPHGRLGDLDVLIDKVIAKYLDHERKGELVFAAAEIKQDIIDLISEAPTIIPAEGGET